MARRLLCSVALGVTVALAACSDSDPQGTTEPQFDRPGSPSTTNACTISNTLVNNYFQGSAAQVIRALKDQLPAAGQGTSGARTIGFQIMDSIGAVSRRSSNANAGAGAALTIALIPCMFANASDFTYPTNATADFTKALTSANGGSYFVRGGGTGGADSTGRSAAIVGTTSAPSTDGNLSVLAPSTGSWTTMLAGNTSSEGRALIYGYLASAAGAPIQYEWATIPSGLNFSPDAVVTVCDGDLSASAMILTEAVGVLAYKATELCTNSAQSITAVPTGWGPRALAARLGRILTGAVAPEPLHAAALLSGTGGTTSKIPRSIVSKLLVGTNGVSLDWVSKPPAVINGTATLAGGGTKFPVSFNASAAGNSIAGFCAYLVGQNNNGTPTELVGPRDAACTALGSAALSVLVQSTSSDAVALADFGQVGVTKVGGIVFTGFVQVVGRAGSGGTPPAKSNVKPPK